MKLVITNFAIIAAAAATAGCAPGSQLINALPAKQDTTARATVSTADLDLSSEAGRRTAQDRIKAAVQRLCNTFSDDRRVDSRANYLECSRGGLQAAQPQLNFPAVMAHTNPAAPQPYAQ